MISRKYKHWTKEEDNILRDNWEHMTDIQLTALLPGCTVKRICARRAKLGLVIHYQPNWQECPNCHKRFHLPSSRIKQNIIFCSRQCKTEFATLKRNCLTCGREFTTYKVRPREHCSKTCANATMSKLYKGKDVGNHSSPSITKECEYCGTTIHPKPSRVKIGKGRFCSPKCYHKSQHRTNIETKLGKAIDKARIPAIPQYQLGKWSIDFAIPSLKIAIEADGNHWHSLPHVIDRDNRKALYLERHGWSLLRFDEFDILNHVCMCIQKIQQHINRRQGTLRPNGDQL